MEELKYSQQGKLVWLFGLKIELFNFDQNIEVISSILSRKIVFHQPRGYHCHVNKSFGGYRKISLCTYFHFYTYGKRNPNDVCCIV